MAVYQQPEVITKGVDNVLQDRLKESHDDFRDSLLSLAGYPRTPLQKKRFQGAMVGAIVGAVAVLICLNSWRGFRTIDSRWH